MPPDARVVAGHICSMLPDRLLGTDAELPQRRPNMPQRRPKGNKAATPLTIAGCSSQTGDKMSNPLVSQGCKLLGP